jgi:hypothetical protein
MSKQEEINDKLKALNNGELIMNNSYVTLSFLQGYNEVRLKTLNRIVDAEDPMLEFYNILKEENSVKFKLEELRKKQRELDSKYLT